MHYLKLIVLYAVVIVILHLIPTSPPGGNGVGLSSQTILFIRADYLLHMLIFVPWMILVWLYLNKNKITGITRFNQALLWFWGGLLLAALAEGLHYIIPHRSFNHLDLLFNMVGVILGAIIFLWAPKPQYAILKKAAD